MADRPRSEDQLSRILRLLPLATREAGVELDDLARRLGVAESEIVRDLGEVIGRSYYRPAGSADDVTVLIEPDRVEVWTAHEFRRPARLNRREAIALGLGLRMLTAQEREEAAAVPGAVTPEAATTGTRTPEPVTLAAGAHRSRAGSRSAAAAGSATTTSASARSASTTSTPGAPEEPGPKTYGELAARLEGRLLSPAAAPMPPSPIEVSAGAIGPSATHGTLAAAVRDRRRCRIVYLRSGAAEAEAREIDPYVLLIAGGRWYVVGYCHTRAGVRVFRVDRMLDAERLADEFVVPPEFDPSDYVSEGRVYRAEEFEEVVIRYSPRIARWMAEQGPTEPLADGSVQVRYSVADPRWAVRHVLEHAPEAEVLSPASIRAIVRATALTLGS